MDVEWPDRREDILNALDVLSADPPMMSGDEPDPRWPGLTAAVHWLVDDTWWDRQDASTSIGTVLRTEEEAAVVSEAVAVVVRVAERQGATTPDAQWFGDPEWPLVQAIAGRAAEFLRTG